MGLQGFPLGRRGHICCDGLQVVIKTGRGYTAAPCWWADEDFFSPLTFFTNISLVKGHALRQHLAAGSQYLSAQMLLTVL